ncbi:AmmeMemoRadiSam system protein B [Vibrio hangzhouensis]|uniref:AmmeMemoRadiSam system protein B n=1 Tax=Vibrio hangzhouensis TaxID=462991 RepID=UPI001C98430C|nr:AmmeMemoRadiSam system protein B [Vibrio hangzhouensis]MBY6196279.1 AmmeMemoRadiSam system protein B [Vibrio hangzhouensis]
MTIRPPAVAGRFYSDDPAQLTQDLIQLLSDDFDQASGPVFDPTKCGTIRGLIVPHAGYVFSGRTAGLAYRLLKPIADQISRVILVGPSHRVAFEGCAVPKAEQFSTPLGNVTIDQQGVAALMDDINIIVSDQAHELEHSLEVHLPFLQRCLGQFTLLPIVTCDINAEQVARMIEPLWDPHTLLVVSSDLSHFHSYSECNQIDENTCRKIESGSTDISPYEACGSTGINAANHIVRAHGYHLTRLSRINSGDTQYGDKQRVVGYVSYTICQ